MENSLKNGFNPSIAGAPAWRVGSWDVQQSSLESSINFLGNS